MNMSRSYFRTRLLLKFTEKNISNTVVNEISKLFGRLKPEEKEDMAKICIQIVDEAETEQEALNKIKRLIEKD